MGIIHSLSDIDWFEWNGVKCAQYGMHVRQQPSFIRPSTVKPGKPIAEAEATRAIRLRYLERG